MFLGKTSETLARLVLGIDDVNLCVVLASNRQRLVESLRALEANKLSGEPLLITLEQCGRLQAPEHTVRYIASKAMQHAHFRKIWVEMFSSIASALNRHDIEYMFIKLLRVPYVMLADIDVIPKDPIELLKIISVLLINGCERLYRFRLLSHPLKVMVKCRHASGSDADLDLYPSVMWIKKVVADNETLFENKTVAHLYGISVPVPSPPLDMYVVATHAYSHLRFTLAEILHVLNLSINMKEKDWNLIMELASKFGTVDALYTNLKLASLVSKSIYDAESIPEHILEELKGNASLICNKVDRWLKGKEVVEFPVEVPAGIGAFASSIYHCRTLLKNKLVGLGDLVEDFASHYLAYFAKIVMG